MSTDVSARTRRISVGLVTLIFAGVLLFVAVFGDPAASPRSGELEASASIVAIDGVLQAGTGNGDGKTELTLEFKDPNDGESVRFLHRENFDDATTVGDERRVAFDPANPADARVLNDKQSPAVMFALAAAALALAIASFAGVDLIGMGILRRRPS